MYSEETIAIAEFLASSPAARQSLINSLKFMDAPATYSGQRFDQTQTLATDLHAMMKAQQRKARIAASKPSPAIEAAADTRTRIGNTPEHDTDADGPEEE